MEDKPKKKQDYHDSAADDLLEAILKSGKKQDLTKYEHHNQPVHSIIEVFNSFYHEKGLDFAITLDEWVDPIYPVPTSFSFEQPNIVAQIQEQLPEHDIKLSFISLQNGIMKPAVLIKAPKEETYRIVYIDKYLELGKALPSSWVLALSQKTVRDYKQSQESELDLNLMKSYLLDFNKIKDSITYRLVKADLQSMEFLQGIIATPFFHLLKIPCVNFYEEECCDGFASVIIKEDLLKIWGVTAQQVFAIADKNMQSPEYPAVETNSYEIFSLLKEIMEATLEASKKESKEDFEQLSAEEILTNAAKQSNKYPTNPFSPMMKDTYSLGTDPPVFGAAAIFHTKSLEEIAKKLQTKCVQIHFMGREGASICPFDEEDADSTNRMVAAQKAVIKENPEKRDEMFLTKNIYTYNVITKEYKEYICE